MDKIYIRELLVRCIIGLRNEERRGLQDVIINVEMETDLRKAGQTDNIEDSVDYSKIKKKIFKMAAKSEFYLVEHMAQKVADICLENDRIQKVKVTVDKPGALRFARSVGVEIVRER